MKVQEKRLVNTLQELVRIPSHESCDEISRHVASKIRRLGIESSVDRDGNIIARIGTGQALLLNAHMDTVGVKGYRDAFSGRVAGGKLYGRGSTDDKSGMAAMLEILRALKENPPKKQVIFTFTVWEETGDSSRDGAYKMAKNVKATHGIVLEPSVRENSSMDVTIGCKGRFVYTIEVLGRASHSGLPEAGVNSIYLASKLIERLKEFKTTLMKIPGFGKNSSYFNITQIEAKEGSNVIPGKCLLTADYRALPGEKEPEIRSRIEEICREVLGDSYRIFVEEAKQGFAQIEPDFMKLCKDSVKEAGMKPFTGFSFGWNDAAVFSKAGIATFKMGPGTTGQDHMNPEYCWIPGLVKGTQAVLNTVRRWDAQ